MGLLLQVLKAIDDNKTISERLGKSEALRKLVDEYTVHQDQDASLPTLTNLTTGRELKSALDMLPPEHQLSILTNYFHKVHGSSPPGQIVETPVQIEERKLRHWFVKFATAAIAAILLIMVGAVVSVIIKTGTLPNASIFTSIMTTATEILKLIFSTK